MKLFKQGLVLLFVFSYTLYSSMAMAEEQQTNSDFKEISEINNIIDVLVTKHLVPRKREELESVVIQSLYKTAGYEKNNPASKNIKSVWALAMLSRPTMLAGQLKQIVIRALMDSYGDPRNRYINGREFNNMLKVDADTAIGIGVKLRKTGTRTDIFWTVPGSPARAAGIPAFSELLGIEDESVSGKPLKELYRLLRGDINSDVDVQVRLPNGELRSWLLTRKNFKTPNIEEKELNEKVVYLRVYQIGRNTAKQIKSVLRKEKNISGLILDLRQTPGGLLTEASNIVDLFIDKGNIFCLQQRHDNECFAAKENKVSSARLILLVDESTASGAELIAAVLQNRGIATLIGYRTYGYANVQVVLPLSPYDHGTALLTTSQIMPDGGQSFHERGVIPDICMANTKELCPRGVTEMDANGQDKDLNKALALIQSQ